MNKPIYLGDGVYADYDGYHIVLHVNSYPNPAIYLEDKVIINFLAYIDKLKRENVNQQEK